MMKSPPFKFCLPPLSEILTLAFGCSYQKILLFLIFLFKNSFVAILIPFATTEIVATDWRTTSTPVGIEADLLPFPIANIISSYYAFFHISVVFIWTFKSLSHTQKTHGFRIDHHPRCTATFASRPNGHRYCLRLLNTGGHVIWDGSQTKQSCKGHPAKLP